ncbi:hypothetical protein QWJ07_28550 [Frankia sp. RB7]|nr:hypothetical protein [Frankia sp. RB7]
MIVFTSPPHASLSPMTVLWYQSTAIKDCDPQIHSPVWATWSFCSDRLNASEPRGVAAQLRDEVAEPQRKPHSIASTARRATAVKPDQARSCL